MKTSDEFGCVLTFSEALIYLFIFDFQFMTFKGMGKNPCDENVLYSLY